MFPPSLTLKVISLIENAGIGISVVQGIRSDDLPAPCVSVLLESADNFNISLADVYRCNVMVKYEEHYADSSSAVVQNNFNQILDQFTIIDLVSKLNSSDYYVFQASVANVNSDIQNDFFVNEFSLEIIAERKV